MKLGRYVGILNRKIGEMFMAHDESVWRSVKDPDREPTSFIPNPDVHIPSFRRLL